MTDDEREEKRLEEIFDLRNILENPHYIKLVRNPSLELQLAAVKRDSMTINYISDPSEEVMFAAMHQNMYAIAKIGNPTIKIQRYVLENIPQLYAQIRNLDGRLLFEYKDRIISGLMNRLLELNDFNDHLDLSTYFNMKYSFDVLRKYGIDWPEIDAIIEYLGGEREEF